MWDDVFLTYSGDLENVCLMGFENLLSQQSPEKWQLPSTIMCESNINIICSLNNKPLNGTASVHADSGSGSETEFRRVFNMS